MRYLLELKLFIAVAMHATAQRDARAEDLDLDELHEANTQLEAQIVEVRARLESVRAAFDELARDCERVRNSLPTQRYGTYKRAVRELLDEAIASVAPLQTLQVPQTPQSPPPLISTAGPFAAFGATCAAVPRSATCQSLAKTAQTQSAKQDASKSENASPNAAAVAAQTAGAGDRDRERLVKQESVSTTDSASALRRPDGSEKAPMRKQNTLSVVEAVLRKQPTLTRLDAAIAAAVPETPHAQKHEAQKESRSSVLSVLKRQSTLCQSETHLQKSSEPPTSQGAAPDGSSQRSPLAQQESLSRSQSQESHHKQRLTLQLGLFARESAGPGPGSQTLSTSGASGGGWPRGGTPTISTSTEAKSGLFGIGAARRALNAVLPDTSASLTTTPTAERR